MNPGLGSCRQNIEAVNGSAFMSALQTRPFGFFEQSRNLQIVKGLPPRHGTNSTQIALNYPPQQ